MPRSRVIAMIAVVIAWIALMVFAIRSDMAANDAREALEQFYQEAAIQAERDLHVLIAVRAQMYTLQTHGVSVAEDVKETARIESQAWLDSLRTGGVE